jgi:hypothetical protein
MEIELIVEELEAPPLEVEVVVAPPPDAAGVVVAGERVVGVAEELVHPASTSADADAESSPIDK